MSDRRVGSLDNPGHYGARSLAVYENGAGLYFKLDGVREKIHGNSHWTKLDGTSMRGRSVYNDQARVPLDGWSDDDGGQDDEEAQIQTAIRASLEDMESTSPPEAVPAADVAGDEAPAGDAAGSGSGRTCAVCLTEDSVMLMRPCNHLCACETCSRRLGGRACVICRRPIRSMERVFF